MELYKTNVTSFYEEAQNLRLNLREAINSGDVGLLVGGIQKSTELIDQNYYQEPETTYRLQGLIHDYLATLNREFNICDVDPKLVHSIIESLIRGAVVPPRFRREELPDYLLESWRGHFLRSLGLARMQINAYLKNECLAPDPDPLSFKLVGFNNSATEKELLKSAALLYRLKCFLYSHDVGQTTQNGHRIEVLLNCRSEVEDEAAKFIDYYYRPDLMAKR